MKRILLILGSVLFLFSTFLITASATQIPVVGEYDYGNLEHHSLIDTYEYTLSVYTEDYHEDYPDGVRYDYSESSLLTPSFSVTHYESSSMQYMLQWENISGVPVNKFYICFAVSDLSLLSQEIEIGMYDERGFTTPGFDLYLSTFTLYDQFFANNLYYVCYSYDLSDFNTDTSFVPTSFNLNLWLYTDSPFYRAGTFSIVQFFTTSSLTYPIKDSGVSVYTTPSGDQTPGTFELKHNIYGYPWELTVEDDRPQSIYFDRQQGLMTQRISYDYGQDTFIDKMKLVYFIVGDNPQFGVSIISQDDYGSLITSVPEFKVETGIPYAMAPVEWNGDEIMPDYFEVTIDLKGYNLADCTINISCLVDALEDPNPNNANRINYFFFFGNFIGYYTKDLSQTVDPNLKWVTFIGDKLDAILENFKAPSEESMGSSNNLQQESDELHQIEDEIIGMLPSVDFNAVEGQVSALQGLQGQIKGNLILSSIASAGPVPQLMYLGLLMGVGAVLLFINKR